MKSTIAQVLIAGAGTGAWWNAGDEAILYSMISELRQLNPNVKIGVLSMNPPTTLANYDVQEINISEIDDIFEFARRSDLLVLGGGGLFFDYWGFKAENILTKFQIGHEVYIGFALLASVLNKPLMTYATGIGPLFSDKAKEFTFLTHELANIISVRDHQSKELLESLGIPSKKIFVTADPAWNIPNISAEKGKVLLKNARKIIQPPILAVAVRTWTDSENKKWEELLAKALDQFIEKTGGSVIFLPFHKELGPVDDHEQSKKILNTMTRSESGIVFDSDISLEEKISLIRNSDCVIGMRLHANIFAMRFGIPTIGLAYDPKVTNLFNEAGMPEYVLDIDSFSSDDLFQTMQEVIKNHKSLQDICLQVSGRMGALEKKNIQLLESLCEETERFSITESEIILNWYKTLLIQGFNRNYHQAVEIDDLKEQLRSLTQRENELNQKVGEQNILIQEILSSSSWKITQPLRKIKDIFDK